MKWSVSCYYGVAVATVDAAGACATEVLKIVFVPRASLSVIVPALSGTRFAYCAAPSSLERFNLRESERY